MAKLGTIIADFRTALATKMSIGATTGTLQSATDDDGVALPAGRYFFTIDGDNSQKEHISCELNGTDLTSIKSVSRQGVETSGTVREHRVGASVVITNFAHIKYLNDMVGGDLIWDTPDLTGIKSINGLATPNSSETTKAANVDYVNNITLAGAADASTTVKGIVKLSSFPASPTEPIACGTNDPRLPTTDEKAALVGLSGTAVSVSNKLIDAASATATPTAGKIPIADGSGKLDNGWISYSSLFGNGIDGDVTISVNTSLSRDMYYNDLTINNGVVLNPNGYRIFVKGTLNCVGTGKIASNGNNGGNGTDGNSNLNDNAGGSAGVEAYITGTLPLPRAGRPGGTGRYQSGANSSNGIDISKGIINNSGSTGGAGGAGVNMSGGVSGAVGIVSSPPSSPPYTYLGAYNMYDFENGTFTQHNLTGQSVGGGGGGGGQPSGVGSGGGGGGSGSSGGVVWLFANKIITANLEAIGGNGGKGGNGYHTIAGSGGGGGGGNGGLIILNYASATTINTNVSGGNGGLTGSDSPGTNGADGNDGLVIDLHS